MSEQLLATRQARLNKTVEEAAPKAWRAGRKTVDGQTTVTTKPYEADQSPEHTKLLEDNGYDPERFKIVGPVRQTSWTAYIPEANRDDSGEYTFQAKAYRFQVIERPEGELSIDELIDVVNTRELTFPSAGSYGRGTLDPAVPYVVALGDLQLGKALSDDTPVFTPGGWVNHGDIRPGDYVFGPDGKPKRVTAVTGSTVQPIYRVVFDRGVEVMATGDHIWEGRRRFHPKNYRKNGGPTWEWREGVQMTTQELLDAPRFTGKHTMNRALNVALAEPLELPEADLPIPPHLLGLWLGDGASARATITKGRVDYDLLTPYGYEVKNGDRPTVVTFSIPGLTPRLRELGLLGNKHIPEVYLNSSADQRLALVQGLMDTDGHCSPSGDAQFSNARYELIKGMQHLLTSLGFKYTTKECDARLNGEDYGKYWKIDFCTRPDRPVFTGRKLDDSRKEFAQDWTRYRQVQYVEPAGEASAQCITVEGGLYLAGEDLVVTHNCDSPTERLLERTMSLLERAAAPVRAQLEATGVKFSHIHVPWLGDCVEGVNSQGGRLRWRTTMTITEQVRVLRRLMLYAIELFAPLTDRLTVVSVPGNHDEANARDLDTKMDDSWAIEALNQVSDALEYAPERFGHVECYVPAGDEEGVTMEVGDTIVAHVHGHTFRANQEMKWWAGQSFGGHDLGRATVLLHGHQHHWQLEEDGFRKRLCVPAIEEISHWWRQKTGTGGSPGLVTFQLSNGELTNISKLEPPKEVAM